MVLMMGGCGIGNIFDWVFFCFDSVVGYCFDYFVCVFWIVDLFCIEVIWVCSCIFVVVIRVDEVCVVVVEKFEEVVLGLFVFMGVFDC